MENKPPLGADTRICATKITLTQNNDSNDSSIDGQFIEVESHDAGAGVFFTIKTERWAFDSLEELITQISKATSIKIEEEPEPKDGE